MTEPRCLVLGTHNAKKGREMARLLQPYAIRVATLDDLPRAIEVEESGQTFAENARLKAVEQARHLEQWVLAEDSGIAVDALGGRPGVHSARYAGQPCDDQANNRKLLEELAGLAPDQRGAHYVCHMALADPQGAVRAVAEGICRGRIRRRPAGDGGFGYDPLFEILEYHRTFGELGPSVKGALSHRGRAMRAMLPRIAALLGRAGHARAEWEGISAGDALPILERNRRD